MRATPPGGSSQGRLRILETLRELLDQGVSELASSCVFVIFTLITIFFLDWRSGLLLCLAAIPVIILFIWYQRRSEVLYRESRVVSAKVISTFVETMTGIRAVKAFRRETANDENYSEIAEKYRVNSVRSFNLFGVLQPGLVLIGNLSVAALLAYGGFRIIDGTMQVGAMVAILLASKRLFQPVEQIAMFYSSPAVCHRRLGEGLRAVGRRTNGARTCRATHRRQGSW